MTQSANGDGPGGGWSDDAQREALLMAQAAQQEPDVKLRKQLAESALEIDPLCADALIVLADDADNNLMAADLSRCAMDAAARRLGPRLEQGDGLLWALGGARPYLRARLRLAEALCQLGLTREAASHGRELIMLDREDHQGARFGLLGRLLQLGELADASALLSRFSEDPSTVWAYGGALLAFLGEGESRRACDLLEGALELCPHTGRALLGYPASKGSRELADKRGLSELRQAWRDAPRACDWIRETMAEQQSGNDALHPPLTDEVGVDELMPPEAALVLELLEQQLEDEEHAPQILAQAEALWESYFRAQQPMIRKPAVFAGALEYLVRYELGETVTQAATAHRYRVHVSSISRVVTQLDNYLGELDLDDGLEDALVQELRGTLFEGGAELAELPLDESLVRELGALPQTDESWLGACRLAPFQVMEPAPHRPTIALWYATGGGTIVGQELYGPTVPPHALFNSLIQAIFAPVDGAPRRPRSVMVEDPLLAGELREVLEPLSIGVESGDLAGIDELMMSLERFIANHGQASYLENGVCQDLASRFFAAAAALRRAAPWDYVAEGRVLGVDIDHWDEQRVCVSVIGRGNFERGLLIFHELDDYLQYFRHATLSELDGAVVGAPVELLSVIFEPGAELQTGQRREVFKHGWEVVGPEDYPVLLRVDPEGAPMPLTPKDYRLATACAEAVSTFCAKYQAQLQNPCQSKTPQRERVPLRYSEELSAVQVVVPPRA